MPKPIVNRDPNAHTCQRTCSKCGEIKYLIDFPFKSAIKQTYRGDCRVCRNIILHRDNQRRKQLKENKLIKFHEHIIQFYHQQTSSQLSF